MESNDRNSLLEDMSNDGDSDEFSKNKIEHLVNSNEVRSLFGHGTIRNGTQKVNDVNDNNESEDDEFEKDIQRGKKKKKSKSKSKSRSKSKSKSKSKSRKKNKSKGLRKPKPEKKKRDTSPIPLMPLLSVARLTVDKIGDGKPKRGFSLQNYLTLKGIPIIPSQGLTNEISINWNIQIWIKNQPISQTTWSKWEIENELRDNGIDVIGDYSRGGNSCIVDNPKDVFPLYFTKSVGTFNQFKENNAFAKKKSESDDPVKKRKRRRRRKKEKRRRDSNSDSNSDSDSDKTESDLDVDMDAKNRKSKKKKSKKKKKSSKKRKRKRKRKRKKESESESESESDEEIKEKKPPKKKRRLNDSTAQPVKPQTKSKIKRGRKPKSKKSPKVKTTKVVGNHARIMNGVGNVLELFSEIKTIYTQNDENWNHTLQKIKDDDFIPSTLDKTDQLKESDFEISFSPIGQLEF